MSPEPSPLFFISTLPSDLILILAVVSAAGVGALFVGIHKSQADLFSTVTKGFIAGFVALLIIKGGTVFFTVDSEVALENSNPFSAVFLGVIAGLFTDKAFNALERVVKDSLDKKSKSDGAPPDSNLREAHGKGTGNDPEKG